MTADGLDEVARVTRDLIRFDTSNFGAGRAHPEAPAAAYARAYLEPLGLTCQEYEAAPGRVNLVARWEGSDPTAPALLLHAHLDVVPADAAGWTHPPFAGDVADGMLWGRGAVDMKNFAAMMMVAVATLKREGFAPRRDIVLAFFADEEAGCDVGSEWMVRHHPEAFHGVADAVGEGGGYSIDANGRRAYLMNTGEKGLAWLRLTARGVAGHGALPAENNPVLTLADAVARVGAIEWPTVMTGTTAALLGELAALAGLAPETDPEALADVAGPSARRIRAGLRTVSNVTVLRAGGKENVVPGEAEATVDVRFIPGEGDAALAAIREAAGPDVEVTVDIRLEGYESPFDGRLVGAVTAAIAELDPEATVVPHLIPGGTDGKALSSLGIRNIGFIPLRLPADFAFPAMFHGVDERVPLSALTFGEAALRTIITNATQD